MTYWVVRSDSKPPILPCLLFRSSDLCLDLAAIGPQLSWDTLAAHQAEQQPSLAFCVEPKLANVDAIFGLFRRLSLTTPTVIAITDAPRLGRDVYHTRAALSVPFWHLVDAPQPAGPEGPGWGGSSIATLHCDLTALHVGHGRSPWSRSSWHGAMARYLSASQQPHFCRRFMQYFWPALPVKRRVCARFPFASMSGYGGSPPFARSP